MSEAWSNPNRGMRQGLGVMHRDFVVRDEIVVILLDPVFLNSLGSGELAGFTHCSHIPVR